MLIELDYSQESVPEINIDAIQKWIPIKTAIPFWGVGSKGDFCGQYLCITEKASNPEKFGYIEGGVVKKIELCYYNTLAKEFQDSNREWVKVTHWTQIPELPPSEPIVISREQMINRVESGELTIIYNMHKTDELYQFHKKIALSNISSDESLFYSSTKSNNIENYIYAIKQK